MARKQIAVIGAGISGLAAAHRLLQLEQEQEDEYDITLFDRSRRLGGVINTERVADRVLEWGPENFVAFKPTLLQLISELGIRDRVIGSNDERRGTYVASGGRLNRLPEGMAFLAPVNFRALWGSRYLSTTGKLRVCLEPLIPASSGDLTVAQFTRRRLGSEMCEKVVDPLISAIYGGDIQKLSMAAALSDSFRMEQEWGSLWRGMRQRAKRRKEKGLRGASGSSRVPRSFFLSLETGMQELPAALEEHLAPRVHLLLGQQGLRLAHRHHLVVENGEFEAPFDAVIVATPAGAAAEILKPVSTPVSGQLAAIPYSSVSLVYLAYRKADFAHPLDAFGFVTAADEARVLDACTFVSSKFENRCPADEVLLRCAVHNGRFQRSWTSEEELVERIEKELERLLGIVSRPLFSALGSLRRAMPQPVIGHRERLQEINRGLGQLPGVFLCGAYSGGVGLPDSAASGRTTALEVSRYLSERSRDRVGGIAHPWAISPIEKEMPQPRVGSEVS